ncbi:MAG TPA: response regulator transcription factor [Spirochaetia bacterium]|nr:response regulator transcription factor [Spirochaetia bacterium]
MRILIVEDDPVIAEFIDAGLKQAGFAVDHVETGEEGFSYLKNTEYDAAVVDIMLPGMDGLSMIARLRTEGVPTPILVLSAKRSVDDRVLGFQKGGDDYLVKPFSFSELLVRVQALIRRATIAAQPTKLAVGDLSMDLLAHQVSRAGDPIDLQPKEYALLEYFMRNPLVVLSKTMIMSHVWNYDFDPQTNVVDVLVSRLRNKIDKGHKEKLIHTIRGVGYVLKPG